MSYLIEYGKKCPPWLMLLFLAPILGELVSAHQTPLEFINPINFLILSLPYGIGALVCRELAVRWNKGIFKLLLLGIAYGIFEEAIVVYSVFDPNWGELGSLTRYGFFGGVNWTWGMMTVHFHTVVSIISSVVLTEIVFYKRRNQKWLGTEGMVISFIGLILWVPIMMLIMILDMKRSFPPLPLYSLSLLAVPAIGWAAYLISDDFLKSFNKTVPRPIIFFFLGLANMTLFFLTVFITPEWNFPPLFITIIFLLLLDVITLLLITSWSGNGELWDDRHRLAFISGALSFFVYFCFAKDFEKWTGSSIIGILTIICLLLLAKSVGKRRKNHLDVLIL